MFSVNAIASSVVHAHAMCVLEMRIAQRRNATRQCQLQQHYYATKMHACLEKVHECMKKLCWRVSSESAKHTQVVGARVRPQQQQHERLWRHRRHHHRRPYMRPSHRISGSTARCAVVVVVVVVCSERNEITKSYTLESVPRHRLAHSLRGTVSGSRVKPQSCLWYRETSAMPYALYTLLLLYMFVIYIYISIHTKCNDKWRTYIKEYIECTMFIDVYGIISIILHFSGPQRSGQCIVVFVVVRIYVHTYFLIELKAGRVCCGCCCCCCVNTAPHESVAFVWVHV